MKLEPAAGYIDDPSMLLALPESPIHPTGWLGLELANDLFESTSELDMPSGLSEDERLLDAISHHNTFGSLDDDDALERAADRQMIMAEAAAAGIHRSGMRRHAFSTGDLQALQPNPDEAPLSFGPPPSSVFRMGSMALRAPRLESVPEGSVTQLTSSRPAVDRPPAADQFSAMSELHAELDCSTTAYQGASAFSAHTVLQTAPECVTSIGCLTNGVPSYNTQMQGPGEIVMQRGSCFDDGGAQALQTGTGLQMSAAKALSLRPMGRSQSAVDLHLLSSMSRAGSSKDLRQLEHVTVELMTPEGHVYRVGRLSAAERAQKILKYRQKRHERNFTKRIKYQCRKTLADSRPRVRGRFARNDDAGAVLPHETKKAIAAKTWKGTRSTQGLLAADCRHLSRGGEAARKQPLAGCPPATALADID